MSTHQHHADDSISRRTFIATGAAAGVAASGALTGFAAASPTPQQESNADGASDAISSQDVAAAEKTIGMTFTDQERENIVRTLNRRRAGFPRLREVQRDRSNDLAPATVFNPRDFVSSPRQTEEAFVFEKRDFGPLPSDDEAIAFAPAVALSHWIHTGQLTSTRLTKIYLERIRKHAPTLECIITVTEDLALAQAKQADEELAAGNDRGPLHGLPYGAKDLFDTDGIATTWGATPYKDRVATRDAHVVTRLREAGAVLIAKTTLGALAYGDIWFGGTTKNPWNLQQGSSGSSAGSASGVVAGLFAFSLGTETYGSIVSPSMRCGATGLRPTFGRVGRGGAMALCWSLDKIGPITRSVEDTIMVLDAMRGADPADPSAVDTPLNYRGDRSVKELLVGYDPAWFEGRGAVDADRAALDAARKAGVQLVEVTLPDLGDIQEMLCIVELEAAAAFEVLTLTDADDTLVWQSPQAWPNTFRSAWFQPAIDYIQAQRKRREVFDTFDRFMQSVDAVLSPSFAQGLLLITNMTGHPCLTLRSGFRQNNRPHGVTLWGNIDDEGTLARIGSHMERVLDVASARPPLS